MTTGTVKTKGTKLYFAVSDSEIHYVSCATGIQGLGGPTGRIDTTCLDSLEMEYAQGLADPASLSVPFNVIPASAAHQALLSLKDTGDTISWMAVLSNQTGAPTALDSDGRLVSPGPTTAEFLGYVADIELDIQTNEIVRGTLQVQRSGAVNWDHVAASLP
jgi:hypothetical protein